MSNFLTIEQWNEFCNLSNDSVRDFSLQSTKWQKLDAAVRTYIGNQGDQQRVALKKAFDNFIQDKGGIFDNAEGKKDINTKRNHFGIILALNTYINEIAPRGRPPATPIGANTTDVLSPYLLKAKIKYKQGKDKEWKDSIKKAWKDIYKDLKERAAEIYDSITKTGQNFAAAATEGGSYVVPDSIKAGFKSFEIACKSAAESASNAASSASNAASRFAEAMRFWRSKEPKTSTQKEPQEQKSADSGSGMDTNQLITAVKGLIQFQISQVVAELITQYKSSLPATTLTDEIFSAFWDQMKEEITSDLESIIPYYGLAKEGAKAFKHIKKTATRVVELIEYDTAVKFLNPSNKDVVACLDSVDLLLKQIAAETAAKAAVASANFAFGVAAAVGTAGIDVASSITGTVTAGIKFLYLVSGFVGTYFAMEEANRLLNVGNLKSVQEAMEIFPLLGAFVIVKLYPDNFPFDDQDRSQDIFILFDIIEQLKPPFDGPLIQLYQHKTQSIIKSAKFIVAKSHFEVTDVPPTPVPIPDEPNAVDPRPYFNKWYILTLARKLARKKRLLKINMEKTLLFNMALIIAENHRLHENIRLALTEYKKQLGGGPSVKGYRIFGGGGNTNRLGVSWQSRESKNALAVLEYNLAITNDLTGKIAKIEKYVSSLSGLDALLKAYSTEAELYVDSKVMDTRKIFERCLIESSRLLLLVQYVLNRGIKLTQLIDKEEVPGFLKQDSRLYNLIYQAYKEWRAKFTEIRQLYNKGGFLVVIREEPT